MRTKHKSFSSDPALSGVLESGGRAYLSPQVKLVSLSLERAILNDSDGTTSDLGEGGQHF